MKNRFFSSQAGTCFLLFAVTLLLLPSLAQAARYVDPRRSMSGYQSWCSGQGGSFYNDRRGVGCTPGGGTGRTSYGGYTYGGSNPYQQMFSIMGNIMGNILRQSIQRSIDNRRKVIRQRRIDDAARIRRQELLRKQAEEARIWREEKERKERRKFLQAKKGLLGTLKGGAASNELKLKGPGTGDGLKIKDVADVDGEPLSAEQREACSAYLMTKAEENAGLGNFSDAAFLSDQASQIIKGGVPGVRCPQGGSGIPGRPIKESQEMAELLKTHSKLYGRLYRRVDGEMDTWKKRTDALEQSNKKFIAAEKDLNDVQKRLAELEARRSQAPGSVSPGELSHARGELQRAKQNHRAAAGGLDKSKSALIAQEKKMKKTHALFEEAKNKDNWNALLQRVGN